MKNIHTSRIIKKTPKGEKYCTVYFIWKLLMYFHTGAKNRVMIVARQKNDHNNRISQSESFVILFFSLLSILLYFYCC